MLHSRVPRCELRLEMAVVCSQISVTVSVSHTLYIHTDTRPCTRPACPRPGTRAASDTATTRAARVPPRTAPAARRARGGSGIFKKCRAVWSIGCTDTRQVARQVARQAVLVSGKVMVISMKSYHAMGQSALCTACAELSYLRQSHLCHSYTSVPSSDVLRPGFSLRLLVGASVRVRVTG